MDSPGNALRLQGKVAVITGAASGIGEATARLFVAHGAKVILADVNDADGEKLAQALGGPGAARYIHCDVSQEEQVAAAVDLAVSAFGGLNVMHNNAGIIGPCAPIDLYPMADFERAAGVLLRGPLLGVKHAARAMKAAGRGGSIITTTSVAAHLGGVGPLAYTMCKHALLGLTKNAAYELRNFNIRVNDIAPGPTATQVWKSAPEDVLETLRPNEAIKSLPEALLKSVSTRLTDAASIANAALFLACDDSNFVSGHSLVVDGSHSLIPETGMNFIYGKQAAPDANAWKALSLGDAASSAS